MLPFDGEIERSLVALGLGAARTVPLVWLVPAFGGPSLPGQIRLAIGLGLAVLCYPVLVAHVPAGGALVWLLLLGREVMTGVTMGFVASCMFRAVESAGRITDILRGANMAEVIAPLSEGRTSPLGNLLMLFAVVVFLKIGGVGYLVTALARSYDALPVDGVLVEQHRGWATAAVLASAKLIESAVGLAAPAIVALLLVDVILGVLGRAAPQVPLFFVGMPLKALLGVGVVLLGLASLDAALFAGFRGFLALFERVLHAGR
jgi:flagellar biosynthetic protein FliR